LASPKSILQHVLVLVLCGVILGGDDQTAPLPGAPVDGFHDVDELLLVLQRPVDLIIVSRAQINHHVLQKRRRRMKEVSEDPYKHTMTRGERVKPMAGGEREGRRQVLPYCGRKT